MRNHLRILTGATFVLLALAGVAAAVGAHMNSETNANASTDQGSAAVSGNTGARVTVDGKNVSVDVSGDASTDASVDTNVDATGEGAASGSASVQHGDVGAEGTATGAASTDAGDAHANARGAATGSASTDEGDASAQGGLMGSLGLHA